MVSITFDGWSADTTKMGFQGMTAHWIDVKDEMWKMRAAIIGLKAVSGNHSGENLGRHVVSLLDRVDIMDKNGSKVSSLIFPDLISYMSQLYMATLDNTSNNNTTCKVIEEVHVCRGLE